MKGTRLINYGTPKHVQLKRKQNQPFRASKKPNHYCIKTKQKHEYLFIEENTLKIGDWKSIHTVYKCTHCGKKKLKDL